MTSRHLVLALAVLSICASTLAAPAPWYQWRSKLTSEISCVQVSPGSGWERASGPYKDARCTVPGRPGQ